MPSIKWNKNNDRSPVHKEIDTKQHWYPAFQPAFAPHYLIEWCFITTQPSREIERGGEIFVPPTPMPAPRIHFSPASQHSSALWLWRHGEIVGVVAAGSRIRQTPFSLSTSATECCSKSRRKIPRFFFLFHHGSPFLLILVGFKHLSQLWPEVVNSDPIGRNAALADFGPAGVLLLVFLRGKSGR